MDDLNKHDFEPAPGPVPPLPDRDASECAGDIVHRLRSCAERHGYRHFLVTRLPVSRQQRLSDCTIVSSWPAALTRSYDAMQLFADSRLVAAVSKTKLPVALDRFFLLAEHDVAGAAAGLARQYGLLNSTVLKMHSTSGEAYLMVYSGNRDALSRQEAMELHYASAVLFENLDRTVLDAGARRGTLSPRERACLHWAAEGKTSEEIATLLGLTVYAVSSYFRNAVRKLGTVNRMQAIACALRLRII